MTDGVAAASNDHTPLLEMRGLRVGYELYRFTERRRGMLAVAGLRRSWHSALHDITATIPFTHPLVVLTGPNGAGKTSLLRAIAGQLPNEGELHWKGRDLSRMTPLERYRNGVVMVPADDGLFPDLTVGEYLRLVTVRDAAASELVNRLGAITALSRPEKAFRFLWSSARIGDLSGGERRLLTMLRLLARSWSLILLDEPLAGMSPAWRVTLAAVLRYLSEVAAILMAEQYSRVPAARALGARVFELDGDSISESLDCAPWT